MKELSKMDYYNICKLLPYADKYAEELDVIRIGLFAFEYIITQLGYDRYKLFMSEYHRYKRTFEKHPMNSEYPRTFTSLVTDNDLVILDNLRNILGVDEKYLFTIILQIVDIFITTNSNTTKLIVDCIVEELTKLDKLNSTE